MERSDVEIGGSASPDTRLRVDADPIDVTYRYGASPLVVAPPFGEH